MKAKTALVASIASLGIAGAASADTLFVDLTGAQTWSSYFNPAANFGLSVNIGAGSTITAIDWTNITVTALGASYVSEFSVGVCDGALAQGAPYWESNLPGSPNGPGTFGPTTAPFDNPGAYASTEGFTTATGDLFIYTYELFDDGGAGVQDSVVDSGGITITYTAVPAPGALALLGLAGVVGGRRRRNA